MTIEQLRQMYPAQPFQPFDIDLADGRTYLHYVAACILFLSTSPVLASAPRPDDTEDKLQLAVSRGLRIVEKAAASYPNHRGCFSCHHQTLPILAMVTSQATGMASDSALVQAQAEFTGQSFESHIEEMREGRGIGGTSMTVGYGLWALYLADWKADDTTEAMVTYLLGNQQEEGHWKRYTSRPPLEESDITCTVLAAVGIERYAAASQRSDVEAAVARAKAWLVSAPTESQEDRVFALWGLHMLRADPNELRSARESVVAAQREDGGWAQLEDIESDAYATGQTLFVLRETGLAPSDPVYQRGIDFLLRTQCEDGSWLVETRSKPIQVFFDNGDPHGANQFISIPATSWAVAALARARS